MAAKVFVLKKPAKCADCGKELEGGVKVRGYRLQNGGWKIYCLKHEENSPQSEQSKSSAPPASNAPPATNPQSTNKQQIVDEVLGRLRRIEEKVDRLLALIESRNIYTIKAGEKQ